MTVTEEVVRAAVKAHHGAILEGKSQVDALVALLFAVDPTITAQAKAEALREAADEIGWYVQMGADGDASPQDTAKWLRARAATIESESTK